ncbi:MAG TPA: 3-phosphoshikimate 1-carboxyvinyltransferase [Tepidisphaeraceae bacterium]|jgi:3-phosphoshikimate 1-carboxyvinyltransferase
MSDVAVQPFSEPFNTTITPPGSKSLTNRALVLAAIAQGRCTLSNVLFADDTLVMLDCLGRLGMGLEINRAALSVSVSGRGGNIPANQAELFCGNSGTTIRFLSAMCALGRGRFNLDGIARMRQRPIGQLVDLLKNLGGRVSYVMAEGFPPIEIQADGLAGGIIRFGGAQSSQYLSAVLQAAPYCRHEVTVDLVGEQTSWPYVAMTMRLMDEFGSTPHLIRDSITGDPKQIIVPQDPYQPTDYAIEPDASNAAYFLAMAAIHPESQITIPRLGKDSLQGDVGFVDVLRKMGAATQITQDSITVTGTGELEGIEIDLSSMPDQAQTLGVVALFATGETIIRGLHTLRVKETDRIAALATELRKLGAEVEVEGDDITIRPPGAITPAQIDTYDDHRMAMSFAVAGTRAAGVVIKDAECVNKTYPNYFADLEKLRDGRSPK